MLVEFHCQTLESTPPPPGSYAKTNEKCEKKNTNLLTSVLDLLYLYLFSHPSLFLILSRWTHLSRRNKLIGTQQQMLMLRQPLEKGWVDEVSAWNRSSLHFPIYKRGLIISTFKCHED